MTKDGGNIMNNFRKSIAVTLVFSIIFAFSVLFTSAGAASKVTIKFAELPYDIAADPTSPTRTDWPAISANQGYTLGKEYKFAFPETDEYGKTFYVVQDGEYSVDVARGSSIEFKVAVAAYVEPTTVKVLVYNTGTSAASLYNAKTGEPKSDYVIAPNAQSADNLSSHPDTPYVYNAETGAYEALEGYTLAPGATGIFALSPNNNTQNLTVNVSEYHLYNTGFLLNLEDGADYSLAKYTYNPNGQFYYVYDKDGEPEFGTDYSAGRKYYGIYGIDYLDSTDPNHYKVMRDDDYANKIIYTGETVYVGIEIPKTTAKKTYHHDTYTLSYSSGGLFGFLPGANSVVLKDKASYNPGGTVISDLGYTDKFVFGYETDHSYVDIYKIEGLSQSPTFTADGVSDLDLSDLTGIITGETSLSDLTGKSMSGFINFFKKFFNLIKKILSGLGISIGG